MKTDTATTGIGQQRRSRMRRASSGKRLALTARDFEIFSWLERYRYLRSTYLHPLAGGASETRFKERLGDLFHEGFLDRPDRQWDFALARYQPAVYELGPKGRRALAEHGGQGGPARTYLGATTHRQFAHATMICDCLASIELATRDRPDIRFIAWGEILARAPERTQRSAAPFKMPLSTGALIPDAIFGLEYRTGNRTRYRFFALEVDRGTMPVVRTDAGQSSLLGKLATYQDVVARQQHRDHLGVSTFLVLTILPSTERLAEVLARLGDSRAPLLFKCVSPTLAKTPDLSLLSGSYQRLTDQPLNIGAV